MSQISETQDFFPKGH